MSIEETGTVSDYGPMDTRYAVYWSPRPGDPIRQLADAWLGRDPDHDARVSFPVVSSITPERLMEITAFPRRYGFHATLKAPFALVPDMEAPGLVGDVEAFASNQRPFRIRLKVGEFDGYLALVLAEPSRAMTELAAGSVREFDAFRAPLTDAERRRRQPERLTERQCRYLERWGYPWVFEDFRFHMTLAGPLDAAEAPVVRRVLEHAFGPHLAQPVRVDHIALFTQTHEVAPFRVVGRFPFRS